jgi:riboflavin synthase
MFTGIIEYTGRIISTKKAGTNVTYSISSPFLHELKIDQSVAHNGVCLTIDGLFETHYTVTAIDETLQRTNLRYASENDIINLERCMKIGDRLDGHIVQGHVDAMAEVINITDLNGSWAFEFAHPGQHVTVEKGSITVNGVSLTVVKSEPNLFSVAIIPYTYENTNFCKLKIGDFVNIEYDIVGKYIQRLVTGYMPINKTL